MDRVKLSAAVANPGRVADAVVSGNSHAPRSAVPRSSRDGLSGDVVCGRGGMTSWIRAIVARYSVHS